MKNLIVVSTFITSLFILFFSFKAEAQFETGLISDYSLEMDSMENSLLAMESNLSIPGRVDLKDFCPTPGHQGNIASSVAWAVGYTAMSIIEAQRLVFGENEAISYPHYSPLFIYNQLKHEECKSRLTIVSALRFVKTYGNILKEEFEGENNDCEIKPTKEQLFLAEFSKIQAYRQIFNYKTAPKEKTIRIKEALAMRYPVVIDLNIDSTFSQLIGEAYWNPDGSKEGITDKQALVVVGYDDRLGAIQLCNSWGTGWGEGGFIWVKYEIFEEYCEAAYIFSLQKEPKKRVLSAQIKFKFLKIIDGERILESIPFEIKKEEGVLSYSGIDPLSIDDLLKIEASIPIGQYAYLISINSERQTHIEWELDYFHGDTTVIIPHRPYFQFSDQGKTQLVFLFSLRPIKQIESYSSLLRYENESINAALRKVLNNKMVLSTPGVNSYNEFYFEKEVIFRSEKILPAVFILDLE